MAFVFCINAIIAPVAIQIIYSLERGLIIMLTAKQRIDISEEKEALNQN